MLKEEISKQLTPILEATKNGILKAADILKEQVPDLVNEIYCWEFTMSIIGFLFGIVMLIGTCYIMHWSNKDDQKTGKSSGSFGLLLLLFVGISFLIMISNFDWAKILIAPKLFLIEYISDFIK